MQASRDTFKQVWRPTYRQVLIKTSKQALNPALNQAKGPILKEALIRPLRKNLEQISVQTLGKILKQKIKMFNISFKTCFKRTLRQASIKVLWRAVHKV